jgi:tRNA1(Val) A37 N6-methylase TrmN6
MKTTFDGLLNRRITFEQPETGYRVAMDTVFLAAAVPVHTGEKVLDLGCGAGGAMLCLAARVPGVFVTGIEVQNDLVKMCRRNIARNNFQDRLEAKCGDVSQNLNSNFLSSSFDHVMMNPPYHDEARHDASADETKRTANTEKEGGLSLWIENAARALKPSGTVALIHRADRLDDIMNQAGKFFGAFEILPLLPAPGAAPKRVILRAHKGKNTPPRQCKSFVLHEKDGRYTEAAESISRYAQAVEFALA